MAKEIQIPAEFARLLDSDWREAAVYGGRGSLKSHTVARILLIKAMSRKGRAGCFREFQNSIADSSHALLKGLIEEYELPDFKVTNDSIVNTRTGYDFIFKGLRNNIQSVKSLEGITDAWVEEAQTISGVSIDVLTPTIRLPGSQIIYTYNRLKDKDPVHERLVIEGRPNTLVINVNYDVAMKYGWLSDVLRFEMEDDKLKRPEVYKHKWLGEPSNKKGRIFPNWGKIEKIPPEARLLGYGLDFGFTNDPAAITAVWKYNNQYILEEVAYETGLNNFKIANLIRAHNGLEPAVKNADNTSSYVGVVKDIVVADSAEPKSIKDIELNGVTIMGAIKGKDSVNYGIEKLQELDIVMTADSHNIEDEQLNYVWAVDNKTDKSKNVPIDAYNHAIDGIRYKITHLLNYKPVVFGKVH